MGLASDIFEEITERNLETYLKNRIYDRLFYPGFFPDEPTGILTFDTLVGSIGNRIAADVVAYESSAPEKGRRAIGHVRGAIPPIRLLRILTETNINEINILLDSRIPARQRILELIYGDVNFCMEGVLSRLEWMCLQALSQGRLTLTEDNNDAGIRTETDIDFGMPEENKRVVGSANGHWTSANSETNDPIKDIEDVMESARETGASIDRIYMNRRKWLDVLASKRVREFTVAKSFLGSSPLDIPADMQVVNSFLSRSDLPQIVIVDTRIGVEDRNHQVTFYDPWRNDAGESRNVLFAPSGAVGRMLVGPIASETNTDKTTIGAKRGPAYISRWSENNPRTVFTMGETNAFPSWRNVDSCFLLDTESNTTFGG